MATHYGQLTEFDKDKEEWSSYIERLELFFEANDIDDGNISLYCLNKYTTDVSNYLYLKLKMYLHNIS